MKKLTTSLLVAMSLAATVVLVAGPASASPTKKKPTTTKTTTTKKTTTKKTAPKTTATTSASLSGSTPDTPGSHFFVINGTANAASDHEIAGSTAFPNFRTGAVDNYYSMTHAHVDNSPFAEGTASPADTGPIGQTAAAGNFQQPQYADARWPGDSGTATVGTQGQPYASAKASEYSARGDASEASQGFNRPSGPSTMASPKGFDLRLQQVLAAWKAKWQVPLGLPTPPLSLPKPGTLDLPKPGDIVKKPTGTVTTPTVPIPVAPAPITTPTVPLGGLQTPPPPATVPLPPVPRTAARETATSSRSLASAPTAPAAPASGSASAAEDGMSHLEASAATRLDQKANTLVTAGESSLGRVSLGGGQIVIKGIYVSAMISNDGTPTYKAVVDIADASIGGVPVTIDQDGVHLAGQGQGVPYQQASDGLNAALKQAGIQLFLVGPEVTRNTCDQTSPGSGTGGDRSGTTPSSSSCDQSGMTSSSSSCDQSGSGSGTTTTTSSGPPSLTPTTTTNPCDQSSSCSQTGSASGTTSTTTTTAAPAVPTSTTSRNRTSTTSTTSSTSSCGTGMSTPTSTCTQSGTTPTTTSSYGQTGTTSTMTSSGTDTFAGTANASGEMTVTATGLHVVFTQPAGAPSGVPAQNAEHILGEVFLDSLAVPAEPAGPLPNLNLNSPSSSSSFSSSSSSSSSSCLGGLSSGTKSSGGVAAGNLSAGGSNSSGSLSPSGYASTSQPGSSAAGSPLGTSLAHLASWARHKPKWLLLSYLVWQALALAAAASLWKWQGEGAS